MSVTVELKPETEVRLAQEAEAKGLKIETYIEILLDRPENGNGGKSTKKPHFQETATPEEWMPKLRRYADSHPKTGVALSDEATRRENIY